MSDFITWLSSSGRPTLTILPEETSSSERSSVISGLSPSISSSSGPSTVPLNSRSISILEGKGTVEPSFLTVEVEEGRNVLVQYNPQIIKNYRSYLEQNRFQSLTEEEKRDPVNINRLLKTGDPAVFDLLLEEDKWDFGYRCTISQNVVAAVQNNDSVPDLARMYSAVPQCLKGSFFYSTMRKTIVNKILEIFDNKDVVNFSHKDQKVVFEFFKSIFSNCDVEVDFDKLVTSMMRIQFDRLEDKLDLYLVCLSGGFSVIFFKKVTKEDFEWMLEVAPKELVAGLSQLDENYRYKFNIMEVLLHYGDEIDKKTLNINTLLKIGRNSSQFFDDNFKEKISMFPVELIKFYDYVEPQFSYEKAWSFEEKLTVARSLLVKDPNVLAQNLLFLFEEDEIEANSTEFEKLYGECYAAVTSEKERNYLDSIKMFLQHKELINLTSQASSSSAPLEEVPYSQDGVLWEYIGSIPSADSGKGNLQYYKLRKEYDLNNRSPREFDMSTKLNGFFRKSREIFPALEFVDTPFFTAEINPVLIVKNNPVFAKLGYEIHDGPSGTFWVFPDYETIIARWEALRSTPEYAHLPPLSIGISRGVATPEEYIQAFFDNDVLLAEGLESVHDQQAHVIMRLHMMSEAPKEEYFEALEASRKVLRDDLEKIKKARAEGKNPSFCNIFEFNIGIVADGMAGTGSLDDLNRFTSNWKDEDKRILHDFWDPVKPIGFALVWRERVLPDLIAPGQSPDYYTPDRMREFWLTISPKSTAPE